MPKKKFDNSAYFAAKLICGKCPACHRTSDKDTSVVYRMSRDSVTMRCNKCGLRYQTTWKSIYTVLQKFEAEYNHTPNTMRVLKHYEIQFYLQKLPHMFNVRGTRRKQPADPYLKKLLENRIS